MRVYVTVRCPSVRSSVCLSRCSSRGASSAQPGRGQPQHGAQQQMWAVPCLQTKRKNIFLHLWYRAYTDLSDGDDIQLNVGGFPAGTLVAVHLPAHDARSLRAEPHVDTQQAARTRNNPRRHATGRCGSRSCSRRSADTCAVHPSRSRCLPVLT